MKDVGPRVIRDHLIEQHRLFFPQLPFIAIASVDGDGNVWATIRAGSPGFLQSPDIHTLSVEIPRDPADPAEPGLDDGCAVGLLGIELHTRRRNRLNGKIARSGSSKFDIHVEHSFGNCPRYIQLRHFNFSRNAGAQGHAPAKRLTGLDDAARDTISRADTFFVATYADEPQSARQIDVSHRGGKPGFVRIDSNGTMTIPDFAGNRFFNTLGNIAINGKAGLVFVDFASGDLLQLTGDAEVLDDLNEAKAFAGAERLWRFRPRQVVRRPDAVPLRWNMDQDGWSPHTLRTGDWTGNA